MVKCDYCTLSILPCDSGSDLQTTLERALDALLLTNYFDDFDVVSSNIRYAAILRYADVQIKIPSEQNFDKVGICFEFSGQGINWYCDQLRFKHMVSLRTAFDRFRCLCVEGYKTKCSRFDIAADDKVSGDGPHLLDLDIISNTLKERAFVTKFRGSKPTQGTTEIIPYFIIDPEQFDEKLQVHEVESMNLSTGVMGKTIYLGSRKSSSFVRIYDKLAEQQVKGVDTGDISHWVRFEVEFKHCNAASVFCAFCDSKSDTDFSEYCSRVFLDLIRFVDLDHSRRYESTVCAWWLAFLGDMASNGMFLTKMERNQYVRSLKYFNESLSAALVALVVSGGHQVLHKMFDYGLNKVSKTKNRIMSDYRVLCSLPDDEREQVINDSSGTESGLDFWDRYSWAIDIRDRLKDLHELYFSAAL